MKQINLEADIDQMEECEIFLEDLFDELQADDLFRVQFNLAFEELFVNVCSYAYEERGNIEVLGEVDGNQLKVTIIDTGLPFNPLQKNDPDLNTGIQDRSIGGLGVFLAKKYVDELTYSYKDGQNQTTLIKLTHPES